MNHAILVILQAMFIGMFFLTTFGGLVDVLYNIKNSEPTHAKVWVVPSVFIVIFWILISL